jgi:hypothetical protein
MSELERSLQQVLLAHQSESGLHMIGGQRQLVNRLVEFFEQRMEPKTEAKADPKKDN